MDKSKETITTTPPSPVEDASASPPQPSVDVATHAAQDELIDTIDAAHLIKMSSRWVSRACDEGVFRTAFKPGNGRYAHWRLARSEVLEFARKRHKSTNPRG